MKSIVVAIIAILVIAGGAFVLTRNSSNPSSNSSTNTSSTANQSSGSTSSGNQSTGNTITYSNSGFSPATLTVKSGTQVTIKNTSSVDMQFDSDPHPSHTDDPELNVGVVSPGQSATFTVTSKGTHGYHNHLNPGDIGTIIVE